MSIGNEKMTICYRCGEEVPEVSFYSDHLPNNCKGKSLINLVKDLLETVEGCEQCYDHPSIPILRERLKGA